ncbi:MAG: glutathione peroxidase [Candidatus Omnitrophica bacterium]|nr:glutathione peroxidase [Candidatus Omnitrophota bacterium]
MNIHAISMSLNSGETISLADYKGKVVLIVNTASRCGFTSQYKGLEELYLRYKDRGFVILAFPANNFMGQEPGSNEEIKNFCELKYKITFPLFAKTSVKGADINPLFKYLTEDSALKGPVTWNFNKFLIDGSGQVIDRYDSRVKPLDLEVVTAIEKALPKPTTTDDKRK